MIFFATYCIALHLYALYALPKMLWDKAFKGKYRHNLGQRFGFGFPKIEKGTGLLVWVHAVSVGELRAIHPLLQKIKAERPDCSILLTCISEAGYQDAKRIKQVDCIAYLPFDLPYIIYPLVKRLKPDVVLFSETDLWYCFAWCCKKQGAQICIVNAKISERSYKRFFLLKRWARVYWSIVDRFCAQSKEYAMRFQALGVEEEKLRITGNIKLDAIYPLMDKKEQASWRQKLGLGDGSKLVVIGSTHAEEEVLFYTFLLPILQRMPHVKVMMVPRHLERIESIKQLLASRTIDFDLWSKTSQCNHSFILFDKMGSLRLCYQLADVAIVAGTYTPKVGGHNLLEPAYYGVPILYGPFVHKQKEMAYLARKYGCGQQVPIEGLLDVLQQLLENEKALQDRKQAGKRLFAECQGACGRTWQFLHPLLGGRKDILDLSI